MIWDTRKISIEESLVGTFSISSKVTTGQEDSWWFSGIYGPVRYNEKEGFWNEMAGLSLVYGGKWVLGGDFNVTRNIEEKANSTSMTRSMRQFNLLTEELELRDPILLNAKYTWSNFRETPICCRLDRFLWTVGWEEMYPKIRQEALVRIVSDHYPIIIDSNPPKWSPIPFRFENIWLDYPNFQTIVQEWWSQMETEGWEGYKMMQKLKGLKNML